ncbi:hypothetical protein I8751_17165 [Nostocaceae cyanobacterium CENA357]|uniref:Uncharacterized protein n=1 Tax=Atlanticothrix silvestris CENA357 TaxID=1725252 RepID=A0A8J7HDY9_9CYAN|nr:hypothetical protein [Atlanticothrix silvestris]MBH8554063.1 hypothetical protein [Atlanticothrix silvestris CENA357]
MKIQLSRNVKQRHYKEYFTPKQPKDFKAKQELLANKENIYKLPDKNWEFCYFDLEKEVTYPFFITVDEIKNDFRKEINFLSVIESEFEELITIPEIKELIDSQRVAISRSMSTLASTFEFLDTYQPFEPYYQRLS